MSKFTVKAETLQRFVALYKSLEPKASEDFKCFRIEIYKGKMILIGCNQFVACAEFLGETDQSDDICYIKVNNQLLDSIEKEVNIAGVYTFETLPELAMGTTFTSDGNKYNVSLPLLSDGFTTTAGSSTSGAYLATKWAVPSVNGTTTPVDGMTIQIRVPLAGTSGGILLSIDGGATYYVCSVAMYESVVFKKNEKNIRKNLVVIKKRSIFAVPNEKQSGCGAVG